jgi:predicted anti-sigma-YlaC factor YlaD
MKSPSQIHLDEKQINRAVVDETDLPEQYRSHLVECQVCRKQVEQVGTDLFLFGEHARLSVPPMTKTVSLPTDESVSAVHSHGWFPSFAVAVMTGIILFVYFLGVENNAPQIADIESLEEQPVELTIEDESLMDEVFEIVEYPLPDVMYEIIGEDGEDFDEFLQFVVPNDQDDLQS